MDLYFDNSNSIFSSNFNLKFKDHETENEYLLKCERNLNRYSNKISIVNLLLTICDLIIYYISKNIDSVSYNKFSMEIFLISFSGICTLFLFLSSFFKIENYYFRYIINIFNNINFHQSIICLRWTLSCFLGEYSELLNLFSFLGQIYYASNVELYFFRTVFCNLFSAILSYILNLYFNMKNRENVYVLLTLFVCIFSYLITKNKKILFYYNISNSIHCDWFNNLMNKISIGILIFTRNKVYYNNFIRNMPINLVNKLNMQSETHLNIITERIKLKDRKNENIIEYNNKSIENFLFDFEKVNDDLPLEFLEVLKKSRFSYEELILSLSKGSFTPNKFFLIGNKNIENSPISKIQVLMRITKSLNLNEEIVEFLFNDISHFKEIEHNRVEIKNKTIFLAKTAHELKNPVLAIQEIVDQINDYIFKSSNNQGLIRINKEDELLKNFELIKRFSNFLMFLIMDFNNFAKLEEKKLYQIEKNRVNIYELKEFLHHISKSLLQKKRNFDQFPDNLKVFFKIDHKIGENIQSDEIRLKQVLINLLSNSIKFTKSGFINLKIKLTNKRENNCEGNFIKFVIEDTGEGISEEIQKNMFMIFNMNSDLKQNPYGSGLGLKIVHEICAKIGYGINYKSTPNKKTKFFFYIDYINSSDSIFNISNDNHQTVISCKSFPKETILLNNTLIFQSSLWDYINNSSEMGSGKNFSLKTVNYKFLNSGVSFINDSNLLPYSDKHLINSKAKTMNCINVNLDDIDEPIKLINQKQILKILVVDDDKIVRNSSIRVLRKFYENQKIEIEITEANDGLDCLNLYFSGNNFDIILLDENMKFINGSLFYKISKELNEKNICKSLHVFIATANTDVDFTNAMKALGVKDVITKPLTVQNINCLMI